MQSFLQPGDSQVKIQKNPSLTQVALAAALAVATIASAHAQSTLNLDEVVVTASPSGRSKMKSSDSVTSVGEEAIIRSGAISTAEVLRTVPGIRSESSGGEGNANITVRGAPISAGGGRYVQLQEDGLPIFLFGDMNFSTPDQFLRTDFTTDRVEVVRGGNASTLASNAPGAIVNFVSKTGRDSGNAVGISLGLGNRLNRYDFNLSGSLGADTYYNVGGFTRQGDGGAVKTNFNSQDGSQVKASITKELGKGSYLRLNVKNLDDKTPTLLPVPTKLVNGQIQTISGIDPRNAYFINSALTREVTIDKNGNQVSSNPADGLHVTSRAFGIESKINLDNGWTIDEKMRKASNGGRFLGMFPANNGDGGNTFTGTYFNTSLDNMDNMFNDLKASKAFPLNGGKATFTGGLFTGSQNVGATWAFNQYTIGKDGSYPSTTPVSSQWTTWGGCCSHTYDVRYNVTAPYAALSWEVDKWTVEGSVRRNEMTANGQAIKGRSFDDKVPADVIAASKVGVNDYTYVPSTIDTIRYGLNKVSYSAGANYAISKDTSVYGRVSDGVNFGGDREFLFKTQGTHNGSVAVGFNQLKQQEVGIKHREGNLSLFGTYFIAKTDESNYDFKDKVMTQNSYDAKGVELEVGYRLGSFRLTGGATLTDASITKSAGGTLNGKKPRRQADVVYALTPSYIAGDLEMGAAIIGSSKSFGDDANTITMGAYTVTNLFASYSINKQTRVSFSVNNAFNTLAYTEVEGDGHAARALPGRTAKVSLRYDF